MISFARMSAHTWTNMVFSPITIIGSVIKILASQQGIRHCPPPAPSPKSGAPWYTRGPPLLDTLLSDSQDRTGGDRGLSLQSTYCGLWGCTGDLTFLHLLLMICQTLLIHKLQCACSQTTVCYTDQSGRCQTKSSSNGTKVPWANGGSVGECTCDEWALLFSLTAGDASYLSCLFWWCVKTVAGTGVIILNIKTYHVLRAGFPESTVFDDCSDTLCPVRSNFHV